MNAAEAVALADSTRASWDRAYEIDGARAYREYRPRIDHAIAQAAFNGDSVAITAYPDHDVAAELLAARLRRKGYRLRRMAYGRDFFIEWGEGWPRRHA